MMIFRWLDTAFRRVQLLDFLPLLAIRIYLLPIFYEGAHAKLTGFSALVGVVCVRGRHPTLR